LRLMLTNKLAEAEKHWADAVDKTTTRKFNPGEHDPTGPFLFVGAMTALLNGLATLENNQLSDAAERFKKADEAISLQSEWPGKTVLKGLCMMLMGLVQTFQGNKTQGVWLILRSWLWLRLVEKEALTYQGPERSLVRSTALLALGAFNLIVSLLPPFFLRTASWCSGLDGSRETAIGWLRTCWEEDGLLAPFAVMVLVGYQVDVRTWLGEPHCNDAFDEARRSLEWAEQRFPGGIFFEGLRANFFAVGRDLPKAQEISDGMAPLAAQLPALGLVMHARRASYAQASMEFSKAAVAFREALAVYRKVGRRSFVPAMAANAALCHEMVGESEERDEMIALVLEYKAREDKKKWDVPDKWAFDLAVQCREGRWEPQLELLQLMTLRHRSTMFMPPEKTEEMLNMLRKIAEESGDDVDKKCKSLLLQAEINRQSCAFKEALKACGEALPLKNSMGKDLVKMGCPQYLLYVQAASHFYSGNLSDAKDSLKRLEAAPRDHHLYASVLFKTTQLNRRLGVELKDAFKDVSVPANNELKLAAEIPAGMGEVEWEWALEEMSINFTATFQPADGSEVMRLQGLTQYQAASGPVLGSFEPKAAGTLVLAFDNGFSWVRGKKLIVRVQPDNLLLSPMP